MGIFGMCIMWVIRISAYRSDGGMLRLDSHKLVMGAWIPLTALIHHAYKVGIFDCRRSMSDYECGSVLHQSLQRFLYRLLALTVEAQM